MNRTEFRKELQKIMPGYKWTVHIHGPDVKGYMSATGIQSSGFNRLSTLHVARRDGSGGVSYRVKSSGFGKMAPWLGEHRDTTLTRALRGLQTHYENMASNYAKHAGAIQSARKYATNAVESWPQWKKDLAGI